MTNYSGEATVSVFIERMYDKDNDKYHFVDSVSEAESEIFEYKEISLEVEGSYSFTEGKYHGPPERCYPDDSDSELTSAIDESGHDWLDDLSDEEKDQFTLKIQKEVESSSEDYEPDDFDDYHDDTDCYI